MALALWDIGNEEISLDKRPVLSTVASHPTALRLPKAALKAASLTVAVA